MTLRALALLLALALAGGASAQSPVPTTASRAVAIDWGLAETLVAIGAPPLGLAESGGYREWVGEPALPDTVAEIGLRSTPNLEYVSALRPDVILTTPQFAAIDLVLGTVAPVLSLATYTEAMQPYANATAITRRLGELLGRQRQAEWLIAETDARIARLRETMATQHTRPVLVVNFHDDRHLWVYAKGSLFDDVLTRAGLTNAWESEGNAWGIVNATADQLALHPDAALIVVEPLPLSTRAKLEAHDPDDLLGRMPLLAPGAYRVLPPIWGFGALPSAGRFAEALAGLDDFLRAGADG